MGLIDKSQLLRELCPPLDALLTEQLISEYLSIERRFMLGDWEPAELDGGQFAEIASRILYAVDSKNVNRSKGVDDCLSYLEREENDHVLVREDARSLCRSLRLLWKFRSKRGAVHISPNYSANHMDAKLMLELSRWIFMEILRLFWHGDRERVAKAIRELLRFDVPCVGTFQNALLVQRTDLDPEEEILVLLHYAGESGFSRREIGRHALLDAPRITRTLQKLSGADMRQIIKIDEDYYLTDLGSKRVREELSGKLRLG
ncbi:MAG: hypothetical protein AAGH92_09190 [Planctomycetota bacterium]